MRGCSSIINQDTSLIALRNIKKYRFYSVLNIAGLATGIAASLFIMLFVQDELSFDTFHKDAERVYRIALIGKIGDQQIETAVSSPPTGQAFCEEMPEVALSTKIYNLDNIVVRRQEQLFTGQTAFFADSNFFQMFSFKLLKGDPAKALTEPNTLVLTEALATRYFGSEEPVGKMLAVGTDKTAYKVTGVLKERPENTHLPVEMLLSMEGFDFSRSDNWFSNSFYSYVKLVEGAGIIAYALV